MVVSFLSDYGLHDDFVGVCHGVMARIAPGAGHRPDPRHPAPRRAPRRPGATPCGALRAAGVSLWRSSTPRSAATRRAVAIARRTSGSSSVPTTACCSLGRRGLGGIVEAVDIAALAAIASSRCRPRSTGATCSRRSPRAGRRRAAGGRGRAGRRREPAALDLPAGRDRRGGRAERPRAGHRPFGNVTLDIERPPADCARPTVRPRQRRARRASARRSPTSPPGELLLYEDSSGDAGARRQPAARPHSAWAWRCDDEVRDRMRRHDAGLAARCTSAPPTRPTTARASSPRPARRTGRSSRRASRRRGAGARGARGPRPPAGRC